MTQLNILKSITGNSNFLQDKITSLQDFSELLLKWNQKINLVSKKITAEELWQRHILDSAQLLKYIPGQSKIVDFGSGAGFPAIILALLSDDEITLVESDQRKCAFMQEAKAKFNLNINVICARIEDVKPFDVDVITSRALAPLQNLLEYSYPFYKNDNYMLFLKGQNVLEEIKEASIYWDFTHELFPDAVNKEGGVLKISNLKRL